MVLPIEVLPYGEVQRTFVVLGRPQGSLAPGRFGTVLRFTVKEIDPSTGAHWRKGPYIRRNTLEGSELAGRVAPMLANWLVIDKKPRHSRVS